MDNLNRIIDDLIDHINVLKELGQRTIEMDPQIVRDLTAPVARAVQPGLPAAATASRAPQGKREPLSKAMLQNTTPLPPDQRVQELLEIADELRHCSECALCKSRLTPLPGQGNPNSPDVMFVGPAPDAEDEQSGQAFSGASGELLTRMIQAMGYRRDQVFLTNICKCRPENDRAPLSEEMNACRAFLDDQIRIIRPRTIVVLGEYAIRGLFLNQSGSTAPQGAWTQYHGIPVMPTFHPKYILRFQNDAEGQQRQLKNSVWKALQAVMQLTKKQAADNGPH